VAALLRTEPLVADDRAATGSPPPNETSRLAVTFGD
jgi:hypothetical protein